MSGIEQVIQVIHPLLSDPAVNFLVNTTLSSLSIVFAYKALRQTNNLPQTPQKSMRVDNDMISLLQTHSLQISTPSKKL